MTITTTSFLACDTCSEIVINGYSDAIDSTKEANRRAQQVSQKLPPHAYWLGTVSSDRDLHYSACEFCGAGEAQKTVSSASQ